MARRRAITGRFVIQVWKKTKGDKCCRRRCGGGDGDDPELLVNSESRQHVGEQVAMIRSRSAGGGLLVCSIGRGM
jgi:hypothetical protein